MSEAVLRFAPSPTGGFHLGNARAALFNYLYAKHYGGKLLLRVEDTDRDRSTDSSLETILNGLEWLGIEFDGDPVYQSKRVDSHREAAEQLLESGHAYYAYETPEELDSLRKEAKESNKRIQYNRQLSEADRETFEKEGRDRVVRFKVPEGETSWEDTIRGVQRWDNREIEDFVIQRSDGSPVYNLAVVVDDHNMGVTLVFRSADHLSNTPKQKMLFDALGWEVPTFGHSTLILGSDGKKLSKRHGATTVTEYQERGFLPDAVFNYLALLGWAPGDGREIFTREELIDAFSVAGLLKKDAEFDEQKLLWLNGEHLRATGIDALYEQALEMWISEGWTTAERASSRQADLIKAVALMQPRLETTQDFLTFGYIFDDPVDYDPKAKKKHWKTDSPQRIKALISRLEPLEEFDEVSIEGATRTLAGELGISTGKLIHPTRLAISGVGHGPGLFELMEVLGQEVCIQRMQTALGKLERETTIPTG
jgi:glutamyl-tRNA synthetase